MSQADTILKTIRSNPIKMINIMGAAYSGSTLLTFILASHPHISTVGEVESLGQSHWIEDPSRYSCSCGKSIDNCIFWRNLCKEFSEIGIPINNFQFYSNSALSSSHNKYMRKLIQLGKFICRGDIVKRTALIAYLINRIGKGKIYLNGMKSPYYALLLSSSCYFDTYLIHLTRNAYGQIYSHLKHHPGSSIKDASIKLVRRDNYCELVKAITPRDRLFHLRYEDLCANTNEVLNGIANWIGIDPALFPNKLTPQEHHIIGNQMRLNIGSSIRIKVDEEWRDKLTQEQVNEIRGFANKRNTRYGY